MRGTAAPHTPTPRLTRPGDLLARPPRAGTRCRAGAGQGAREGKDSGGFMAREGARPLCIPCSSRPEGSVPPRPRPSTKAQVHPSPHSISGQKKTQNALVVGLVHRERGAEVFNAGRGENGRARKALSLFTHDTRAFEVSSCTRVREAPARACVCVEGETSSLESDEGANDAHT